MDLKTAQITSNQIVCHSDTQITLENDMNVPDSKPDIDKIIKIEGNISYIAANLKVFIMKRFLQWRLMMRRTI